MPLSASFQRDTRSRRCVSLRGESDLTDVSDASYPSVPWMVDSLPSKEDMIHLVKALALPKSVAK